MNVVTYISDLLYRYECVILPEFGAFLTQRKAAKIVSNTHTFYPPQKALSFNPQLQNNDGLLANYIASHEKCSYTDALAKIQHFTVFLQNELQAGKRVKLDRIGTFFTAAENTIQFEPEQQINYLAESFGLSTFSSQEIIREVQREVLKEEVVALEEKTPITFTPEKRRERPYLKYAAAAVIAISLGLFGLKQYSNSVVAYNTDVELQVSNTVKEEVSEAGFIFETDDTLPAVSLNLTKKEVAKGKYHIIAGAFRVQENAAKKVARLLDQGFDAYIMEENPYGLHQVVFESHSDKYEALRKLRQIKRNNDYNAWLLVKE